jgi:hypothetical protein
MGGIGKGFTDITPQATLEAKVERLTKLVHILWKEAERLESIVKVIPEGLQIKTGFSEVTVLRNGGVVIKGLRVLVETPGKSEFYT